tara:strand:+ start:6149 stop:6583 length:435 start_codon:yes stop_codon:yes gene_type:complete
MLKLNLPEFKILIKNRDNKSHIFDIVRKKFVLLTPEEWVRQHVINFLIQRKISKNHIAVEKKIVINNLIKRFDIVVFDRSGKILVLVECKAPQITLNQKVFDQVSIYNQHLDSKYLMITNGLTHFYLKVDKKNKKYIFLDNFPI